MNRTELSRRVRVYTRDLNNTTFREEDVLNFMNEGIDRVVQRIPEFRDMPYMELGTDEPMYLPRAYHHLLAIYGASRCFYQDEMHYQAGNLMNEFEAKLDELVIAINSGTITIYDAEGNIVDMGAHNEEYVVTNNYYQPLKRTTTNMFADVDEGVDVL